MHTPVFLDNLPDASVVSGRRSEVYRLQRIKALADLMLEDGENWRSRPCPGCGQPTPTLDVMRSPLPFDRCKSCNTIFATRLPAQHRLDTLRQHDTPTAAHGAAGDQLRAFEFVSILNWIRLSATRHDRPVGHVLDYRFASHAPLWPDAAQRNGEGLRWTHLPLAVPAEAATPFADLEDMLARTQPDAVLVQSELDRCADPEGLMTCLGRSVASGRLVFLSSSCADGLEYEILGANSPSFVPLDRLTVFSIKGFRHLAERCGFRCLEISTPGRLDAVILQRYFSDNDGIEVPFWSAFFRNATRDRLQDLQVLLQRSLRSGVMRFVLEKT